MLFRFNIAGTIAATGELIEDVIEVNATPQNPGATPPEPSQVAKQIMQQVATMGLLKSTREGITLYPIQALSSVSITQALIQPVSADLASGVTG